MRNASDSVFWFISELAARVVAETGVPSDRFHLGKLILQSLKDAPDFVLQIDAAVDRSESYKSVLKRTVKCAEALKSLGLKKGDVIVLMGRNHLDLCIPLYAAFYLGLSVAALDAESAVAELESMLGKNQAKVIFCQGNRTDAVTTALKNIGLEAKVVAFNDGGERDTFAVFLDDVKTAVDIENFKAEDFDPAETIGLLTSTGGTTGVPKSAALTHKNMIMSFPVMWAKHSKFPTPTKLALMVSPLQWLSAGFHYVVSPIVRYTRLQSSAAITDEHFYDIVKKYKPTFAIFSPPFLMSLIKPSTIDKGDLTCLEHILCSGSALPQELADQIRKLTPKTVLMCGYGISEASGYVILEDNPIDAKAGRPLGHFEYKIMNPETYQEITEPKVTGELWLRGPSIFKGYFNNPVATSEVFEDGWFRTGDMFYWIDSDKLYFVDRLKLLLKYKNHQISPVELEEVIRQHPGVLDVAVTGFPDEECGELPVACVVRKKGSDVTAQEIKDLVKNTLTDTKQLRGGVIFLDEMPLTVVHKTHRQKLKQIALSMDREQI